MAFARSHAHDPPLPFASSVNSTSIDVRKYVTDEHRL